MEGQCGAPHVSPVLRDMGRAAAGGIAKALSWHEPCCAAGHLDFRASYQGTPLRRVETGAEKEPASAAANCSKPTVAEAVIGSGGTGGIAEAMP